MIVEKLADDYQQPRKTAEDEQGTSKEKLSEGDKHCLVCRKTGHLGRECLNKAHKQNMSSSREGHHNTATREESFRQVMLRCYT